MDDFTTTQVLGDLYTMGTKDLFRRLLWPKMLGWTCADPGQCAGLLPSMQTLFHRFGLLPHFNFSSAHKLYWVSNAFSASFPIQGLCSFLLPDGSDEQSLWLSSPHHVRPVDEVRWPRQSPDRRRWYCPAVSLSFGTAVVNTGFAGKPEFWLNVHFLEKCLLSTGILTFWLRPKKFWPKHLGVLSLFFLEAIGRQDIKKLPQPNSRGNGFILVSFRVFPESLSFFWETLVFDVNT